MSPAARVLLALVLALVVGLAGRVSGLVLRYFEDGAPASAAGCIPSIGHDCLELEGLAPFPFPGLTPRRL